MGGEGFSSRDYDMLNTLYHLTGGRIDVMYVVTPTGRVLRGQIGDRNLNGIEVGVVSNSLLRSR